MGKRCIGLQATEGQEEHKIKEVMHGTLLPFPLSTVGVVQATSSREWSNQVKSLGFDHFTFHLEPCRETCPFNLLHIGYQGDWTDVGHSRIKDLYEQKTQPIAIVHYVTPCWDYGKYKNLLQYAACSGKFIMWVILLTAFLHCANTVQQNMKFLPS